MIINVNEHPEYIFGAVGGKTKESVLTRSGLENFPNSSYSTGVRVRFTTNSKEVYVKAKAEIVPTPSFFGHLLVNGISFSISKAHKLIKIDCATLRNSDKIPVYNQNASADTYEYEIYCPVINTINSMEIIIDDDAEIKPDNSFASSAPIVYLGSSNTIGRGCTAANTSFTDIVAKYFNSDYYNFSIYNNAFLETQYIDKISSALKDKKPWLIVSEICTHSTSPEYIKDKLSGYLNCLSEKFPDSCIILYSQPCTGGNLDRYDEKIKICADVISELRSNKNLKNQKICYIDGKNIFKEISVDRVSVSSYIINDYGNAELGKAIYSVADGFRYLQT